MTDWNMVVETWPGVPGIPNGRHNFRSSRASRSRKVRSGSRRRCGGCWRRGAVHLRGSRHAVEHRCARPARLDQPRLRRHASTGAPRRSPIRSITIQTYEPFHASMQSRFTIEGSDLQFSRHRSASATEPGPRWTGDIDLARWPEQTYQHHVEDRLPDTEEHLLSSGEVHAHPDREISRARSICSRAAAS